MPLLSIENVRPGVVLGLWSMAESGEELVRLYGRDDCPFASEGRRREYFCVRLLLRAMTQGRPEPVIGHEPGGRPFLDDGRCISISHTQGLCSVMLSEGCRVGVDVEYASRRVDRVAERFMRPDEQAGGTLGRLVHWCAKEAMYKIFPEDSLAFGEMRVAPFEPGDGGVLCVENLRRSVAVQMEYRVAGGYVLVFACLA